MMIPITVTLGSAESADYSISGLSGSSLPFNRVTSASFTINAIADSDCDDERLTLGFGTLPSGVGMGSPSTATVDIEDNCDDPTPIPTDTPTPTATLTPRPPVLTGLHDRASAVDIDALRTGEKIGKIYLEWSDAAGIGITYEVEHRVKRVPLLPLYDWHRLPHGDIKIVFNRGPGIITGAVISGLDYDHTYKHRIQGKARQSILRVGGD